MGLPGRDTYFKNDIADKVQRQASEVLIPRHAQIVRQTFHSGVADIAAIQEGEQIQDAHGWEETPIELAEQRLLVDVARLDVICVRGQ